MFDQPCQCLQVLVSKPIPSYFVEKILPCDWMRKVDRMSKEVWPPAVPRERVSCVAQASASEVCKYVDLRDDYQRMLADGGCGNLGEPDRHDDSKAGFRFFFKIWGQHGVNKLLLPQCSDRIQTPLFHEACMVLRCQLPEVQGQQALS